MDVESGGGATKATPGERGIVNGNYEQHYAWDG
jgi:hypothetical protein